MKKKARKPVKIGVPKKRSQSAPPQEKFESIGSMRSMMQRMDAKLSAIPKGGFAEKGEQMGAKFGTLGRFAGRGLGAGLSAITGYGNYTVKNNSLTKVSTSCDMVPQFVKNEHSVRVTHREFISDIVVPANANNFNMVFAQDINAGNSAMFPWLARMAKQYSQYKIHGMVFTFKTMTSNYAANGPLGTIMMATNYDAIERVYSSKIELENSEFAVSCAPSSSMVHAIECDPKEKTLDLLYIRDNTYATAETSDKRFFDYGKFQFATTGLPGTPGNVMGELWVSYDISLHKPIPGGDVLTVPGVAVVSQPSNGIPAINTFARPCFIEWIGNAYTPAGGEVMPISPSAGAVLSYTGDAGIIGPVVELLSSVAGGLELNATGRYHVTWGFTGTTSTGRIRVGSEALINNTAAPTTAAAGSAVVTQTLGPFPLAGTGPGNVAAFVGGTVGTKFSYSTTYVYEVDGIPAQNVNNYVTVYPPAVTCDANAAVLVAGLIRSVRVEFVQFANTKQEDKIISLQ